MPTDDTIPRLPCSAPPTAKILIKPSEPLHYYSTMAFQFTHQHHSINVVILSSGLNYLGEQGNNGKRTKGNKGRGTERNTVETMTIACSQIQLMLIS